MNVETTDVGEQRGCSPFSRSGEVEADVLGEAEHGRQAGHASLVLEVKKDLKYLAAGTLDLLRVVLPR